MPAASRTIAVFGAGSWGTALAIQIARAGLDVVLWGRKPAHIQQMQQQNTNQHYLPDIPFPAPLRLSSDLAATVKQADTLLLVIPSHAFRGFLQSIKSYVKAEQHVVWASKGLEEGSGLFLHQIIAEELPQCASTAVVSGPTFAREVAQDLPTAVTVAASSPAIARDVAGFLHYGHFRAYSSVDIIGVELGGALKNVLAIAAGITDGLGFGANTRAALVTRGLAELMRLGEVLGAQKETLMGLAGLGDLLLTCTDNQSRNRQMGLHLAKGMSVEQARIEIGQAVEGVKTAREAYHLSQKHGVDMPIIEQVYRVIYEQKQPQLAVQDLLARQAKDE